MARPGWYNDNGNRAYPFLKGSIGEPDNVTFSILGLSNGLIVDAGFVVGLASGFVVGQHKVWLDTAILGSNSAIFVFASDAPGLAGQPLSITVSFTDEQYVTGHGEVLAEDATSEDSLFSDSASCAEPLWYGFAVACGPAITAHTSGSYGPATRPGEGEVEPALVQNLADSYVGSLNLANDDRTRVDSASECPPVEWAYGIGRTYVNARCLTGHVRFLPGYNATVRQESGTNTIYLGAAKGAGAGEPCNEEIKLFDTETPPAGSVLLEGGPRCNDVIRSINGVGGQFANLLSGTGVTVINDPERSRIVVELNMSQLSVCYQGGLSEVSESL